MIDIRRFPLIAYLLCRQPSSALKTHQSSHQRPLLHPGSREQVLPPPRGELLVPLKGRRGEGLGFGPGLSRRRAQRLEHAQDQAELVAVLVAAPALEQRRRRVAHTLGQHRPRRPQVQTAPVPAVSEQRFRRPVACRAHLEDLVCARLVVLR